MQAVSAEPLSAGDTQAAFTSAYGGSEQDKKEIDALMNNTATGDGSDLEQEIEKELEALKRKMAD